MPPAPPPQTRCYLVRHCDVLNPGGVLYGFLPGFPLSEKGVAQAHHLGRYMAATPARRIYTSPLLRARQTADIVARYIDGAEVVETDDLIEARFGLYLQGVRPRDVIWRRPLWLLHMLRPGLVPNDESVAEMARRVEAPLARLRGDRPGSGGICISHGDPIQAFWVRTDRRRDYHLHRLECAKGGMLVLDYEGDRLLARRYLRPEEVADGSLSLPARDTAGSSPSPSRATDASQA